MNLVFPRMHTNDKEESPRINMDDHGCMQAQPAIIKPAPLAGSGMATAGYNGRSGDRPYHAAEKTISGYKSGALASARTSEPATNGSLWQATIHGKFVEKLFAKTRSLTQHLTFCKGSHLFWRLRRRFAYLTQFLWVTYGSRRSPLGAP